MKLPHAFIQLPLAFDAERLAGEVAALGEAVWRPHPQGFPGNSMAPLIAAEGDPNNESFAGRMLATPHLKACEYLWQTLDAMGVVLGRTRLMRLDGNAEVTAHADQGYYWTDRVRIHVPIVTKPDVRFICGDAEVHMAPGECWIFDTWRIHRVINGPEVSRIHLVADTVGGERFWQLVDQGQAHPIATGGNWTPRTAPFQAGARPPLALETTNVPDVMTPWEIDTRLRFLLGEASDHPNKERLAKLAADFVRDWRCLWAHHGTDAGGKGSYRARRDAFAAAAGPLASPVKLKNEINLFGAILAAVCNVAIGADMPVQGRRATG